uniref:Uncharacterized protein n=1 Tax=Anguilla anguilla TaxID=7936 RepID=A0A0E9QWU4_ANGAN
MYCGIKPVLLSCDFTCLKQQHSYAAHLKRIQYCSCRDHVCGICILTNQ